MDRFGHLVNLNYVLRCLSLQSPSQLFIMDHQSIIVTEERNYYLDSGFVGGQETTVRSRPETVFGGLRQEKDRNNKIIQIIILLI